MAVDIKILVFWDVKSCRLLGFLAHIFTRLVNSYWTTLRKRDDNGISYDKH